MTVLKVLAVDPYLSASHREFLEGYQRFSSHSIEIWSLSPRKWKWRMRGAALYFAERARRQPPQNQPDVMLATDFLQLADWRALAPRPLNDLPTALYFHENQITYPISRHATVEAMHEFGWINLRSALAADRVLFNSSYHRNSFLNAVTSVIGQMADFIPRESIDSLVGVCDVFPVGLDFSEHRRVLGRVPPANNASEPTIVWNHRWEYDKNPDLMVACLSTLKDRGTPFRLILCGDGRDTECAAYRRAEVALRDRIEHIGFIEQRPEYLQTVASGDFVLSTAQHDFFGVAVVEAMFLGCLPVLPHDLSYPEIVPSDLHSTFLYRGEEELTAHLDRLLRSPPTQFRQAIRNAAARYDWAVLAPRMDAILADTAARRRH